MLEACANQAIGLQAMALQASPRMLALASHGDQASELPLLWSLCSTLAELGYSVLVLDATHSETAQSPGLEQLIDGASAGRERLDPLVPWTILPAAIGLQRLCQASATGQASLRDLTGLSQSCSVMILYASAATLVSLLPHSGVTPLLAVGGGKKALVSAYQALKLLLLNGGLRPSIACMLESIESERMESDLALNRNLQDCAMTFLGYQLESVSLGDDLADEASATTLRALALRLVESGLPLEHFDRATPWVKQPSTAYQGESLMYTAKGQLDRNALIRQYQPLVRRLAHHMMAKLPASVQVDDLIQVGLIGLSEALTRYEAAQGVQFETFATQRIRGAMIDELRESDWMSRGSRKSQKEIEQAMRRLEHELGRSPIESEIAAELDMTLAEYQTLLSKVQGTQLVYLEDMARGNDDEDHFLDRHVADSEADPLNMLRDQRLRQALVAAIKGLPEREQLIMSMYYEQDMNLKEIAAVMNVTESRICQLHSQSIARLRAKMRSH